MTELARAGQVVPGEHGAFSGRLNIPGVADVSSAADCQGPRLVDDPFGTRPNQLTHVFDQPAPQLAHILPQACQLAHLLGVRGSDHFLNGPLELGPQRPAQPLGPKDLAQAVPHPLNSALTTLWSLTLWSLTQCFP